MANPVFREMYFGNTSMAYPGGLNFENPVEMNDFSIGPERRYSKNYCNCVALAAIGPESCLLGHFERDRCIRRGSRPFL